MNMSCIRRAVPSDVIRLAEIEVFNYRLNFYPIFRNDDYYFDELRVDRLSQEYGENEELVSRTYVYDDGVVKGFIRIADQEVNKLFVEPSFQGQAIGSALLKFALEAHQVHELWALEKNTRAIAFYVRHGFYVTKEKKPVDDTAEYLVCLRR